MEAINKVTQPANICNAPTEPGEEWRLIEDPRLEPRYYVSNKGRVKNGDTGLILAANTNIYGYVEVYFCDKRHEPVGIPMHKLVALAFLGKPGYGQLHVDHIDCNPLNNAVENLRWVSPSENMHNPLTLQRIRESTKRLAKKRQHMIECDQFPGQRFTAEELAAIVGVSKRSIHDACAKIHSVREGGNPSATTLYTMRYIPLPDETAPIVTLADALAVSQIKMPKSAQPIWCIEDELALPSIRWVVKLYNTSVANVLEHCDRMDRECRQFEQQGFKALKHFKRITREEYLAWVQSKTQV